MFRRQSAIRTISYIEAETMLRSLSEHMFSSFLLEDKEEPTIITPMDSSDKIPAAMLAEFSDLELGPGGTKFSIFSRPGCEVCIFKRVYEMSELYNEDIKVFLETITVEEDGYEQQVIFEWQK